ncbi:uncharacterized protein LOC128129139 [Lactuca sativa]|uniref:uncharacterized protein LOC128129139 n=1 Tax=Lactuca sativa TaxID=4236 RepID=UPI0022B06E06|nr:uncharacterized protein LOC128129139 [Lactuca sativa]
MYRKYACAIGFDVRKSKNKKKCGIVYMKIFYVTWKVSQIHPLVDTTLDQKISKIKRKTYTSSTGCNARIRFKVIPGTTKWWLYEFEEKHNHPLISRDNMLFLLHDWQLDDTKKSFILTMSNQNIGATIAHRLYTSIHGGYNFVGGLIDDFKNYMRDLNCVIGGSDAQMLVDKLNNRKENLNVLFWADETSKINYKEYHMVFVPFTGIDNDNSACHDVFGTPTGLWLPTTTTEMNINKIRGVTELSQFAKKDVHLRNVYPPEGKSAQKIL